MGRGILFRTNLQIDIINVPNYQENAPLILKYSCF